MGNPAIETRNASNTRVGYFEMAALTPAQANPVE
jgi:hypothetical protein